VRAQPNRNPAPQLVFSRLLMHFSRTSPRHLVVATTCAAASVALALLTAAPGDARDASKRGRVVLGETAHMPRPVCPTPAGANPAADEICQGLGRVTGYQVEADGRHNPYKVRQPGTIVAWGIHLGDPDKKEQQFFETELAKSGPASARLAVLKPKDDQQYKLVKQSPVVQLQSSLGENMVITLTDPLRVRKGMIVAITTTTYVPNLALHGASATDVWRASRNPGQCGDESNDSSEENQADLLKRSRPQQKVGGNRSYVCDYKSTRLLYTAFLATR
jgi:hypothetical protein